jgi:hypothetical protein
MKILCNITDLEAVHWGSQELDLRIEDLPFKVVFIFFLKRHLTSVTARQSGFKRLGP